MRTTHSLQAAALAVGLVAALPASAASPQTPTQMQMTVVRQRLAQDGQTRDQLQKELTAIKAGDLTEQNVSRQLAAITALIADDQAQLDRLKAQTAAAATARPQPLQPKH